MFIPNPYILPSLPQHRQNAYPKWWLNHPFETYARSSNWIISPGRIGVKIKKHLKPPLRPYMDVSKNSGTPKWMVYNAKPYEQMDDLGVPLLPLPKNPATAPPGGLKPTPTQNASMNLKKHQLGKGMVVEMVPLKGGRWHSPSPNWQYIPLIYHL